MSVDWEFFDDAGAFLDVAGGMLERDPVVGWLVMSVARQSAASAPDAQATPDWPRWFAIARTVPATTIVGVAMRTMPVAPYPLYLLPMPDDAATTLADVLMARGEETLAANGDAAAAMTLLARVGQQTGTRPHVTMGMKIWENPAVRPPETLLDGRPRLATPAEADLLTQWYMNFQAEAAQQAGRQLDQHDAATARQAAARASETVTRGHAEGRQWLWEVDGKPVCWAGHSNPSSGVAGIANVFTPRDHRGHGYASALVAHLTQTLHDQGLRVILYTDLANPVSNGVYQRIGYQPIADTAEVRLTPPPQN